MSAARPSPRGSRVALAIVSTILSLAALDRVLCLVYPRFEIRGSTLVPDAELGWKLRPNNLVPEWRFYTNAQGFRGTELRREGPRPLVAFIGDSVTHGATYHDDTFPSIFQRITGARVFNLGVPLYGPLEYVKVLRHVQRYEPDRVVIGYFIGNDVSDCQQRTAADVGLDPGDRTHLFGRWAWSGIYRFLLFRGVVQWPGMALALGGAADSGWEEKENAQGKKDGFTAMEVARVQVFRAGSYVDRWPCVRACIAETARLRPDALLLIVPDEMQVNDALWEEVITRAGDPSTFDRGRPNRELAALAAAAGLQVLDVTDALRASKETPYIRWDSHPSPLGNRIIAAALAQRLAPAARPRELPAAARP